MSEIPGEPLQYIGAPYGYEKHVEHGYNDNNLRTAHVAQPRALRIGDILATGDKVLSRPREAGNGGVWLHLTGGFEGHWIRVAGRIPIAILAPEDEVPDKLREIGATINIVNIFVAPKKGEPMQEVSQAKVGVNFGVEGDRYGLDQGSWSTPGKTHRRVSFIEYEAIEDVLVFTPAETRRNIVTHGARLNDLVGKEFMVVGPRHQEQARFRGTKLCDPCVRPSHLAHKNFDFGKAFENRGGLCAEVLTDGMVHVGSEIVVL